MLQRLTSNGSRSSSSAQAETQPKRASSKDIEKSLKAIKTKKLGKDPLKQSKMTSSRISSSKSPTKEPEDTKKTKSSKQSAKEDQGVKTPSNVPPKYPAGKKVEKGSPSIIIPERALYEDENEVEEDLSFSQKVRFVNYPSQADVQVAHASYMVGEAEELTTQEKAAPNAGLKTKKGV